MVNKKFWISRCIQILLICILAAITALQLNKLHIQTEKLGYQQSEKFSVSLTRLATAEAARYLSQDKKDELKLLIDNLQQDPMIKDATVYDQFGDIIYQSEDSLSLPTLLNLEESNDPEAQGLAPYIGELYFEQAKIGYIRITLEQERLISLISNYQEKGSEILTLSLILTFVCGLIVMIIFYRRLSIIGKSSLALIKKAIPSNKQKSNS